MPSETYAVKTHDDALEADLLTCVGSQIGRAARLATETPDTTVIHCSQTATGCHSVVSLLSSSVSCVVVVYKVVAQHITSPDPQPN